MKRIQTLLFLMVLIFLQAETVQAQTDKALQAQLEAVSSSYPGTIGVAVQAGERTLLHNEHHYPMQSVYKFPLALAILKKVDEGKLSLEQKVHIGKRDLHKDTWSPMREQYSKGNIDLTLAELLRYSVSLSDNNACDILFRLAGGPQSVHDYIHSIGVQEIQIAATEYQMHQSWPVQYTNWCTPSAMTDMLVGFYEGKYLSEGGTAFLLNLMTKSSNSDKRIKGLLPATVVVAHKTGSSGANKDGLTAAVNDVGMITLPDGKMVFLSIFVSDTRESYKNSEYIIARIAKTVYDYYAAKE